MIFGVLLFGANLLVADVNMIGAKDRITHVTLYRDQALVVREVTVPDVEGEIGLIVENLPPSIDPSSLFASSTSLKIRSVRYLTELVPDKNLNDEIAALEKKQKETAIVGEDLAQRKALLQVKQAYLQEVGKRYIAKLGPDMAALGGDKVAVAGFDFASIAQMTEFVFKQQEELTEKFLALAAEERAIADTMTDLQEKLNALRHGDAVNQPPAQQAADRAPERNLRRKAIVYVAREKDGEKALALSYLVHQAGWSPAYNMRIVGEGKELNLEYLAHVRQLTHEDWNGVTLTLSTATPNMNAEVPMLAPMWVRLTASGGAAPMTATVDDNLLARNIASQIDVQSTFQAKAGGDTHAYNFKLNSGAWDRQQLELGNRREILRHWNAGVRQIVQQMAVEYQIPDTVTLASRNDNQMVQIFSRAVPCLLHYEAVPLLAGYVARGIEAVNLIDQPLLAGTYSAFIDGQYVGSGAVPVTATGQTLVLGFGIDPQLRCRRELVDKISDKSWGSRTETYRYRLILDNYKDKAVPIRLLDRIPVTQDKGLEITLRDGAETLCADEEYRELDYPKGILRWDVDLPAATSGAKASKFDYAFDLKFDSDMQISGHVEQIQEQLRTDLMEMEERRK
jgi:hypothetical protein